MKTAFKQKILAKLGLSGQSSPGHESRKRNMTVSQKGKLMPVTGTIELPQLGGLSTSMDRVKSELPDIHAMNNRKSSMMRKGASVFVEDIPAKTRFAQDIITPQESFANRVSAFIKDTDKQPENMLTSQKMQDY